MDDQRDDGIQRPKMRRITNSVKQDREKARTTTQGFTVGDALTWGATADKPEEARLAKLTQPQQRPMSKLYRVAKCEDTIKITSSYSRILFTQP